jgi:hypothetical protein
MFYREALKEKKGGSDICTSWLGKSLVGAPSPEQGTGDREMDMSSVIRSAPNKGPAPCSRPLLIDTRRAAPRPSDGCGGLLTWRSCDIFECTGGEGRASGPGRG